MGAAEANVKSQPPGRGPAGTPGAWTGVIAAVAKVGLPAWFVAWDLAIIARLLWPHSVGIDGNLYSAAASAWLRGGDPWAIYDQNRLAAPPPTLIPFVLTAWLPGGVAGYLWVALGAAAAVWAIRRLGLPLWWLLFPPLVVAIWHGSIEPVVLLLLVAGPRFLAPVVKLYAVLPLLGDGRWRSLLATGVILLVTAPFLPWSLYLGHWNDTQVALREEGFGIADTTPSFVSLVTVFALVILGRRRAGYLAIPALWPSAHFHYASLAIPALASVPLVAVGASMVGAPYPVQVGAIATAVLVTLGVPRRPAATTLRARSWKEWIVSRWRGAEVSRPRWSRDR
jgi:hypothetical protein